MTEIKNSEIESKLESIEKIIEASNILSTEVECPAFDCRDCCINTECSKMFDALRIFTQKYKEAVLK